MIRPLTIATCLLACGSGLYLYQSKHEVQLLDRTIEKTVRDTGALREQSRLLSAEWTMLNDPERLRQFSDTYLSLKRRRSRRRSSPALPIWTAGCRRPGPRCRRRPVSMCRNRGRWWLTLPSERCRIQRPADAEVAADEDLPVPPIPAASGRRCRFGAASGRYQAADRVSPSPDGRG